MRLFLLSVVFGVLLVTTAQAKSEKAPPKKGPPPASSPSVAAPAPSAPEPPWVQKADQKSRAWRQAPTRLAEKNCPR